MPAGVMKKQNQAAKKSGEDAKIRKEKIEKITIITEEVSTPTPVVAAPETYNARSRSLFAMKH